jgi:lipoate-protein ligase A
VDRRTVEAFRVETPPLDAAAQMAMDEALLDGAAGRPLLRRYRWAGRPPHGATFGYFIPFAAAEEAAHARWPGAEPPLVRRPTGGGIVFHDGDLTFSFVFPWPRPLTPTLVYKSIHQGVRAGLRGVGVRARLWSEASHGTAPLCFSRCEPMDLAREDGAKLLGGALRRRRGTGLYQGSLRPEGLPASGSELWRAVEEGISLQWKVIFRPAEPEPAVAAAARRLDRERYRCEGWNKKR